MNKARTAVLVSGRGSNLRSLLAAAEAPDYPAEIVLVLSNNSDAGGLEIARAAGVAAEVVDHRPFGKDRPAHDAALDARLRAASVELIALAGYMRVLTPGFVAAWRGRMINIHPSLLPNFPGLHTHARVLEAGHLRHGATVHWVNEGVDEGEVIGQAEVEVLPGDDTDTLAARVLQAEHRLYPQCLAKAALTPCDDALVNREETDMSETIEIDPADPRQLTLGRVLAAPRDKVWRAWTEPDLLKQWFAPKPYDTVVADLDVRPGGSTRIVMRGPDGVEMPGQGVYLAVKPGRRLVFTDAFTSAWAPSAKPFMVVEVALEDAGPAHTRYVVRVSHWSEDDRKAHETMGFHTGWGLCADQLEAVAAGL